MSLAETSDFRRPRLQILEPVQAGLDGAQSGRDAVKEAFQDVYQHGPIFSDVPVTIAELVAKREERLAASTAPSGPENPTSSMQTAASVYEHQSTQEGITTILTPETIEPTTSFFDAVLKVPQVKDEPRQKREGNFLKRTTSAIVEFSKKRPSKSTLAISGTTAALGYLSYRYWGGTFHQLNEATLPFQAVGTPKISLHDQTSQLNVKLAAFQEVTGTVRNYFRTSIASGLTGLTAIVPLQHIVRKGYKQRHASI